MVDKRNQDFQDLSKRLVFEVEWHPEDEQEFNYPLPTLGPYESDVLFWMVRNSSLVWDWEIPKQLMAHFN